MSAFDPKPGKSVLLQDLLRAFQQRPTAANNQRLLEELRGPSAQLYVMAKRPYEVDGPPLTAADISLTNLMDGTPILCVQAATAVEPSEVQERYGADEQDVLTRVPSCEFMRACDERGIRIVIVDAGMATETALGRTGGPHGPMRALSPTEWAAAFDMQEQRTTHTTRQEREARRTRQQHRDGGETGR